MTDPYEGLSANYAGYRLRPYRESDPFWTAINGLKWSMEPDIAEVAFPLLRGTSSRIFVDKKEARLILSAFGEGQSSIRPGRDTAQDALALLERLRAFTREEWE